MCHYYVRTMSLLRRYFQLERSDWSTSFFAPGVPRGVIKFAQNVPNRNIYLECVLKILMTRPASELGLAAQAVEKIEKKM